jgi:hypothetical protein
VSFPEILTDSSTETENSKITSGGSAVLRGSLLRFDPQDTRQGIFFVAADNPAEEIRVDIYITIRSTEVTLQIPVLEPKNYILIVKSSYYSRTSVRKGEMDCVLTVEN